MTTKNRGFISLHRKVMSSAIWSDANYLKLWIYCLLEASHKDRKQLVGNEMISLERGQFVTGRFSLSDEMNRGVKPKQRLSERTWFRYLENLEMWGMLTIKSTNKYSVVTINKYDDYQGVFNNDVQQTDHQVSNKSPSNDQQMTTNNNVNNANNVNKKDSRKQVYDETSLYYKMTDYFYKLILKNNPQHKKPNYQKWSDDFRKLVELDKRDKDQVRKVMEFVQSDDFEMNNVLSPNKLRQRYDQLFMKTNQSKRNNFVKPRYEVVEGGKSNDKHTEKGGNVQLFR